MFLQHFPEPVDASSISAISQTNACATIKLRFRVVHSEQFAQSSTDTFLKRLPIRLHIDTGQYSVRNSVNISQIQVNI
jgi:hypothetical protein